MDICKCISFPKSGRRNSTSLLRCVETKNILLSHGTNKMNTSKLCKFLLKCVQMYATYTCKLLPQQSLCPDNLFSVRSPTRQNFKYLACLFLSVVSIHSCCFEDSRNSSCEGFCCCPRGIWDIPVIRVTR